MANETHSFPDEYGGGLEILSGNGLFEGDDGFGGVRFIALRGAPESPVSPAFLPRPRNAVLRRFVEAAVESAR